MEEIKKTVADSNNTMIEFTAKAIEKFNLAKESLKDDSQLCLRITTCSRG